MDLEVRRFTEQFQRNCRVICGSIREPMDVYKCWTAGADIVTAPLKVIQQMTKHPKTDEAIAQFQGDIEKWLS
jgi:transaldolase